LFTLEPSMVGSAIAGMPYRREVCRLSWPTVVCDARVTFCSCAGLEIGWSCIDDAAQ
jgi:hypothetical protein